MNEAQPVAARLGASRLTTASVCQDAKNVQPIHSLSTAEPAGTGRAGEVAGNFGATMNDISDSAAKIIDIIRLIDGVAFQIKTPDFHAAVEVARLGEQSRGFAIRSGRRYKP